jgi:hypothetical protein
MQILGASGYADRALRGFRHVKIKKTIHGFFDFGATASRPSNPLRTNRQAASLNGFWCAGLRWLGTSQNRIQGLAVLLG